MPKIYCSNCGNPIQYTDVKPNFCQKCGANIASGKIQIAAQPQIEIIQEVRPKVNNLNWDIEIQRPKGEKLKDLAKGEKASIDRRLSDENLTKEEFLKQFQKEAGTLRRGNHQSYQASDDGYDDEEPEDA